MPKRKPLKVGFDLDGVILYNPARVVRPVISFLKDKQFLIKRKKMRFYIPQRNWEKFFWRMFHKSSVFQAPGLQKLQKLVESGDVEPYIITARFGYLKPDFEKWLQKIQAEKTFKQCFINEKNEQPHLFKDRMIDQLKLDVFIDDNWDIVHYLHKKKKKTQVFWVYNLFDRKIQHPHKYPHVSKVIDVLSEMAQKLK